MLTVSAKWPIEIEEVVTFLRSLPAGFVCARKLVEFEPREVSMQPLGSLRSAPTAPSRVVIELDYLPSKEQIGDRKKPTVWVCGKMRGKDAAGNPAWDLQGVFPSEAAALEACKQPNDFIGPVALGKALPQGATEWPGCRYPLAR